jgi:hypothetical protein
MTSDRMLTVIMNVSGQNEIMNLLLAYGEQAALGVGFVL